MRKYSKLPIFLLLFAAVAGAECPDCPEPAFPEASDFLASHGYPADAYTVLLAWQESAPDGDLISGYRIRQGDSGEPFDLYSDANGNLLTESELDALGIKQKNWNLAPIERKTEIPPFKWQALQPRPAPVAPKLKLPSAPVLALDPLSEAELNQTLDSVNGPEKRPNRIGLVRNLPSQLSVRRTASSLGAWRNLPDGSRVWTLTLKSPGARAMRIHFTALSLPPSATVTIYNTAEPVEAYGPFDTSDLDNGEFWSPSCFADSCTIECLLPKGADPDTLDLQVDKIVHTYKDLGDIEWTKADAGLCNLDVTCYPEWQPVSRGIAGYSFIFSGDELYCTGTLVADSDPDTSVPYFLTANHCMDGYGDRAASMEFFWLYQTSECDGMPPDLESVPRTSGGATLLAREAITDFALVRIKNSPPPSIPFVGWTTEHVDVGSAVTAIHHPSGSHKRISFGHITDTGSPLLGGGIPGGKTYEFFLESLWDRTYRNPEWPDGGITEHGSSGCPLLLRDSQLIVGQLWGGYASCDADDEPDYFGRFEQTFPLVDQWLGEEGEGEEGEGEGSEGEGEGSEGEGEGSEGEGEGSEGEGEGPPPGCFSQNDLKTPGASALVSAGITFLLRPLGP